MKPWLVPLARIFVQTQQFMCATGIRQQIRFTAITCVNCVLREQGGGGNNWPIDILTGFPTLLALERSRWKYRAK